MQTTDSSGRQLCYADYAYKFSTQELINNPDVIGVGSDWFNLKVEDSARLDNLFSTGDDNAWLNNFWLVFNPFDFTLPKELGIVATFTVLVKFGLMEFFKNLAKIFAFYVAKFMFWVLVYGLVIHLWRKAAYSGGLSIYWILILIIAALIIFGVITSYAQFVGYLRFGL
jgi:hypothetical protein